MKDRVLDRLFLRWRERGDGKALAAVFDLTAKELLGVAAHLSKGAAEAEDLVQVVFLRAMERAQAFDPALGLRPWLHGILWREALAARRRAARRAVQEEVETASADDPVRLAAEREIPEAVRSALAGLPRRYREVVEPLLLEDEPAHAIAARLGRSSGTVRMQIHRGLERLRRSLPRGLAAWGAAALPTRGWDQLRGSVLRKAGVSPQAAGAYSTCALVVQAALVAAPALWAAPLAAGGLALVATQPQLVPPSNPEPAPIAAAPVDPQETEPMKPSALLALPVAFGLSSSPAQDGREPVPETVADKVARLDALVGELVTLSQSEDEPARTAWAGLLAADQRIRSEIHRRREAEWALARSAHDERQAWVDDVSQLQDPARRERALRAIEAALLSGSSELQLAACQALAGLGEVKFEKQAFRGPVLAIAQGAQGQLRVSALYALWNTDHRPEDLALALALADDDSPAARQSGLHLLFLFGNGDLTGPTGDAALRILQADTERHGINGLWGARVSPAITDYLLELSHSNDPEASHAAIYFGLSTLAEKRRDVVERLIELASGQDHENAWRSRWGLGHGVPAEHGSLVAAGMRELYEARSAPSLQVELLGLIGQYATLDYLPWLQRIDADAGQPDSVREAARGAIEAIQSR